eukprot:scaffold259608_cov47-Prasinocladus_malaysianus.AAC.1
MSCIVLVLYNNQDPPCKGPPSPPCQQFCEMHGTLRGIGLDCPPYLEPEAARPLLTSRRSTMEAPLATQKCSQNWEH